VHHVHCESPEAGLFTAVHGTLSFVVWRWAVDPDATQADAAVCHAVALLVAIGLRAWRGRRRRIPWWPTQRRAAPCRCPRRPDPDVDACASARTPPGRPCRAARTGDARQGDGNKPRRM